TKALDANAIRGKTAVFTYTPARGGRGAGGGGGGGRGGVGAGRGPRAADARAPLILVPSPGSTPRALVASAFATRPGMRPDQPNGSPAAAISADLAAKIFGRPLNQLAPGAGGAPVSANWTNRFALSKHASRNVIAILPGSDPSRAAQ